ncbi:MAG: protein kinase [Thermaerobacter sp.]|nr:protein kinase [Thermaerobacter sp.]
MDLLRTILDSGPSVQVDKDWVHVFWEPPTRQQGWKLHVSANTRNLEEVLSKAIPVLLEEHEPFKLVKSRSNLVSMSSSLTQAGKAITVYPSTDKRAVDLAAKLDSALSAVESPRIPSDCRVRRGSAVHFRYGAFALNVQWSSEGKPWFYMLDPAGNKVEDRRGPVYAPPSWASSPFRQAPCSDPSALDGKFEIAQVHTSPRSLVLVARPVSGGDPVLIKRAVKFATDAQGCFRTDALANEALVLRKLAGLQTTPRYIDMLDDKDACYMITEFIPAESLRVFVERHVLAGQHVDLDVVENFAEDLAQSVSQIHSAGIVINDLSPGNILVESTAIHIVDFELASSANEAERRYGYTPGFSDPVERSRSPFDGDWKAAASVVFYVASGSPLYVRNGLQTASERMVSLLTAVSHKHKSAVIDIVNRMIARGETGH